MAAEKNPPPDDLEEPGKALWRLVRDWLQARQLWSDVDGPALARYVRAVELGRRCREEMGDGLTTVGSQGQLVQHPLVKTAREAARDAHDYAKDLLLTPAARRRLEVESGQPPYDDSLEAWLSPND